MRIGSAIVVIIIMIASGFLYYVSLGFSPPFEGQYKIPGPAYFPRLLIISLWALCLLLLFRLWQGREITRWELKNVGLLAISAVAMILCVSVMESIGFMIVMPIYLMFQMRLLFYKRWGPILILTGVSMLFVYLVFYRILNVPLPLGVIENFK